MINLNEVKENSISIFNDGEAGVAKGELTNVEKKQPSDSDSSPDYKLTFKDDSGETNVSFYVPDGSDEAASNRELARLLSVARAYFGEDYEFPSVRSYDEAYKLVMKMLKKEAIGARFNLFVCYGYSKRPSKYLNVRKFDFIESGAVELSKSKLKRKKSDVMERITPDETTSTNQSTLDSSLEELSSDEDFDEF